MLAKVFLFIVSMATKPDCNIDLLYIETDVRILKYGPSF